VYIKNSSGSRTVPWGTPDVTGAGTDVTPSTITLWVRPARKLLIQFKVGDCLLYRHIKTNEDTTSLQDDLNNLQDWERDWQMHFNPDKCEVMRITTKRKIIPSSYFIHGKELNITSKGKYLGIAISQNLSWNNHIDNV
jgi:hypothetical protein